MNDIHELKGELKDLANELRQTNKVQTELLVELRTLKPRVERVEERQDKQATDIDQLKGHLNKCLGVLAVGGFVGFPAILWFFQNYPSK